MIIIQFFKYLLIASLFALISILYKMTALLILILAGVPLDMTLLNQKKQLMKIPYITKEEVDYIVNILSWPF